jgi:hypothetical protein
VVLLPESKTLLFEARLYRSLNIGTRVDRQTNVELFKKEQYYFFPLFDMR